MSGMRITCTKCSKKLRSRHIAHGTDPGHDPRQYSEWYEVEPCNCVLEQKRMNQQFRSLNQRKDENNEA